MEQAIKRPLLCATLIGCVICFICSYLTIVGQLGFAFGIVFCCLLVLPFKTRLKPTVLLTGFVSIILVLSCAFHYIVSTLTASKTLGKTLSVSAIALSSNDDGVDVLCFKTDGELSFYKAKLYFDKDVDFTPGSTIKGDFAFNNKIYKSGNNGIKVYATALADDIDITAPSNRSIIYILHRVRTNIINSMPFKNAKTKAFLKAMILGDKSDVSGVFLNMINTVGLSHILAVSGMHLVFSVILIDFLMSLFSIGYKPRAVVAVASILLFTVISGFAVSCIRAAIMLSIFYIGRISEKFPDSLTSLFLSAYIILLFTPYNVLSPSFLLSLFATLGIIILSPCFNSFIKIKIKNKYLSILAHYFAGAFVMSVSASLACLPVTALMFKGISVVSPIVNVIIILPVQILFYIGIFGIILGFITPLAPLISFLGDSVFAVIEFVVQKCYYIKNITFTAGNVLFYPVISLIVLLVIGIILFNRKSVLNSITAIYIGGVSLFLLLLFFINTTLTNNNAKVCFVDVGQANASFMAFDEEAIIFDCGGNFSALNNQLKFNGVKKIRLLALTHTDLDHTASLEKLIDNFEIEQIVYPEFAKTENIKDLILNTTNTAISKDTLFKINDFITVETFVEKAYNVKYYSNISAVYKLNVYNNSVLYTGDMNIYQEHSYLSYAGKLDCDILSVAHHGAAKSSHTDFLELCSPEFSVISVAEDNKFGMPSRRIVDRLKQMSTVLQTSINSNINFKFTPKGYKCLNEY